ncbi:replication restart helicase PriA [Capnocytophaga stomatis]|uniref:replication restart helicase PriA n=1 Tax=Capnocytophaga stomatis TaxID=1848904 RepID=UPI001AD4AA36|nr:primosomal protein N' [Capnocytophaga stomatis]GIM50443.1 primosomal protein N' [Capnocytophaga stomatis]
MPYFVDVILPIPLWKLFTYGVNEDEAHFLKPGMRVAVSFGKSKIYTALAFQIHTFEPTYQTKDIEYILDETPVVNPLQLQHWQWISEFYMCSLGEVFKTAVPSSFLLESETIIEMNSKELEMSAFTDDEWLVYEALNFKTALTGNEVAKIVGKKKALKVLKGLVEKNAVKISEKMFEKYVPKLVKYIRLSSEYQSDEGIQKAFEILSKASKQKQLIVAYFNCINKEKGVLKAEKLLSEANVSASVLKSVVEKGIFEEYLIQKDRVSFAGDLLDKKTLSEAQQEAFSEIQNQFKEKQTVLLQGVTASGKTEIYIELIDQVLQSGKQVLFLLPEIGLTVHLISRLKKYFGDKMGVYHSKYNTNERVEVWNNVLNENAKNQLVVGVRSSVFLPFSNLGLVIVDEEHDSSYRQFEPAPRFHTRDVAIVLSKIHNANVLLGSATPSLESLYNAKREKYGYVYLSKRFGDFQAPDIEIIDMKDKRHRKQITGHFSDVLIKEIKQTLQQGNQVILFQNQRGYAPVIQCESCATVPQCPHCDVSLTYHQGRNQLRCHYCGYAIAKPEVCIACGSTDLMTKGFGTEQIAKELAELFPTATIDRMDQDTTSGKHGYEKILSKFEQRETQILVGTQMISKGLDFENVGLVGVMNADSLIHFPDFRAYERSFQLLVQISGRAGRSSKKGKVLIQTYSPKHPVLQQVLHNNFKEMFQNQIEERREFYYPPFVRLIKITFKHSDFNKVNEGAEWFAEALRQGFSEQKLLQVLGPEFPLVSRIRNEYIKDILIKIPPEISVERVKKYILRTETSFQSVANFRSVRVIFNVE